MEQTIIKIFKELGQFLGKKLDAVAESVRNTPQKIQVDMSDTSKRIEELKKELTKQISDLSEVLSKATRENYKGVQSATVSLSKSLADLENELNGKEFNITVPDLSPAITDLKTNIAFLVNSLSKINNDNAKEMANSFSASNEKISNSLNDLQKIEIPNIKNTEKILTKIYGCVEKIEKTMAGQLQFLKEEFNLIVKAVESISFNVPDTFKLEEMQLRKLAGASKGISVDGGKMAARNVAITNLALTATNVQYTFTFPANTVSYRIKLREQGFLTYYSFTTGTLPTIGGGGDGTKYFTIPQNFIQSQEGVDFSGKIIYFGSESASQVLEIEVYTL